MSSLPLMNSFTSATVEHTTIVINNCKITIVVNPETVRPFTFDVKNLLYDSISS